MTPKILLGFDFGTKRIGVAVGQTVTQSARPLETIKSNQGMPHWPSLDKIVQTWRPDALVVGIPLNMDGTPQPITAAAEKFARLLQEHFQLPVYEMDERLSTVDARQRVFAKGGYKALQKEQIDSIAAQLILETWLLQENHGKKT